ncbi:unnamed protein product [Acanthoscelides obtectus]|uniref:Uncharacterized protein n=1 Tax=Acanthoscelides obtectus TaxID=200917 RepID=A0A9P0JZB5_ACAOB|nr:unnamed protein product [Acanthoscelides obtectus]CAK1646086.1 hypothetical protein AOBTE_LOCUS14446 [Acanthoscelides obtectus]
MWEMQVLSSQKNNGNTGPGAATRMEEGGAGPEGGGEDRLRAESAAEADTQAGPMDHEEHHDHPALRGIDTVDVIADPTGGTTGTTPTSILSSCPGDTLLPPAAAAAAAAGMILGNHRKRPLLSGGGGRGGASSMTPTKRTVMGLLARARAAQAKNFPLAAATAASVAAAATAVNGAATGFRSPHQPPAFDEHPPTLVPLLREDYMSAVNLNLI